MITEILECDKNDLSELSVLWERMILEVMPDATPNRAWWVRYVESFMSHGDYKCFKAVVDGLTVGFIDGSLFCDPSIGEIVAIGMSFYVLPMCRGTVGMRLYLRLVKEGIARGAKHIDLFCYEKSTALWYKNKMNPIRYVMRKAL